MKVTRCRLAGTTLFLIALCSPVTNGQTEIVRFDDRAALAAASANLTVIDFEDLAPRSGFTNFKAPKSLTTAGLDFHLSGGGKFGPGYISLLGAWYYAGPIYETGTGAKLTWAPPNQPGDAYLDVTLPGGVTAVATDLWTAQPYISSITVTVTTVSGQNQTVIVNTLQRPASAFIGFTSPAAISSLRFSIPRGQTGLILDNFTFGQSVKCKQPPAAVVTSPETGGRQPATQSSAPVKGETPGAVSSEPGQRAPVDRTPRRAEISAKGNIAYIRNGTEIWLIAADGTNDRRLWTHADAKKELGIDSLAWRPDGKELAFSSGHAASASLYHSDLYAIKHDGSGFRKLTNGPDRGDFARYPKGTVSVTLRNDQPGYVQSQASAGVFIVYVAGADEPQQVTLPPGSSKILLFKSVADFGKTAQPIVAMWGKYRWFIPGLDVQAGRTVKAPLFSITGDGIEYFGAFRPVWRSDGARVSFRTGLCTLNSVPVNPLPGEYIFKPPFSGKHPLGTCTWDLGPTTALANEIIYSENASGDSAIYRITGGGAHPGQKLTSFSNIEYQLLLDLRWLPDGSGFLFSNKTLMGDSANIFKYDFATRKVSPVTRLENEFAGSFSISPDSQWVVFERSKSLDDNREIDLWVVSLSGGEMRVLIRNGFGPSWR